MQRQAIRHTDTLCPMQFDVPSGGFEWRDASWETAAGTANGSCLVARGTFQRRTTPSPLTLLEGFADLAGRPSAEAIIGFANQYGWLSVTPARIQESVTGDQLQGEPRQAWIGECRDFAHIWEVWQGIETTRTAQRASSMARAARWFLQSDAARPGPIVPVTVDGTFHAVLWQRVRHWLRITHSTTALQPYRLYVARRSLERLHGQLNPTIHPDTGAGICLMANSLLAAIYWELLTLALSDSNS